MRLDLTKLPIGGALLLGLALGIFSVLLALTFLPSQNYRHAYGQALAQLTARYSADEVFNRDLVAQQSLLSELVKYPEVGRAAIYDSQQKLRVQAGNKQLARQPSTRTYSAPITLHDQVAGYVHVTLSKPVRAAANVQAALTWLATLLLLCAVWFIGRGGVVVIRANAEPLPKHGPAHTTPAQATEPEASAPQPAPIIGEPAYAAIAVKNTVLLKQQLSVGVYQNTLTRLEKIAEQVATLYGGSLDKQSNGTLLLRFEDSDGGDQCLMKAACASHLVIEMARTINKIPLQITAFVCQKPQRLNSPEHLPAASVVLDIDTSEPPLKPYVTLTDNPANTRQKVIAHFSPATGQRLAQQLEQLRSSL